MKDSELFRYIKSKKDWLKVDEGINTIEYKVEVIDEKIYVLFQQSKEKTDWISNLNFPAVLYDNHLMFHRGFVKQYDAVKRFVINDLSHAVCQRPNADIIVAGWSLGAALAEIAVEDVYWHTGKRPTLISFGSPKAVFNLATRNFIRACCKDIREYCNRNDIVTYMPPIGYWHLNKVKVGDKFSPRKVIHPYTYHTNYDKVLEDEGK